jgi:hypothetical protein
MSQPQLQSHFFEVELKDEAVTKEQLMELFFDLDFTENEDQYRNNTLEIGFVNEAERVATELLDNEDLCAFDVIEGCIEAQCESSGFYVDYNISATRIDDTYVIAVATMTEC